MKKDEIKVLKRKLHHNLKMKKSVTGLMGLSKAKLTKTDIPNLDQLCCVFGVKREIDLGVLKWRLMLYF